MADAQPAPVARGPWALLERLFTAVRPGHRVWSLLADGIVVAFAWNLTYLFPLAVERWWPAGPGYEVWVLAGIVAVYLLTFAAVGIPRGMWRFSGFGEVKRLLVACAIAGIACGIGVIALGLREMPRSVLALHPLVSLMGLCTVRVLYRMAYEQVRVHRHQDAGRPRRALVMGAGDAARLLIAGLQGQGWTVVALLDDDATKHGLRIGGVAVAGPLDDVTRHDLVEEATHVIAAMPGATLAERRRAVELATRTRLPLLTVPSLGELRDGGARIERVRAIEPEDLLGRETVALDDAPVQALVRGRTVLVTGAGGSIGSELCRQLARLAPARLVLYEISEFNLYAIDQALQRRHPDIARVAVIGDVRDAAQLARTMQRWQPELVFHAAAYKHVPLVEEHNAWAALQNNTLGTLRTAEAAAAAGVERFVLISTDKAVNPTNVMGATKRAAEMALSRLAGQHPATRFMAVRFGNVLGSSGSVIPLFKAQIAAGGPVTVTHPEITRYFMTIAEAVRLVLQAAAIGDSGRVYVLDMGEPVKIVELARQLIHLAGHDEREIPIVFTGLRPGEKLYEELLADADRTEPTTVPALRIAALLRDDGSLDGLLAAAAAAEPLDDEAVRAVLRAAVPEYQPAQNGAVAAARRDA